MIIDFHTHTFPASIAQRAVDAMVSAGHMMHYAGGANEDLRRSMAGAGIDYSVLMPVVTKPHQQESINRAAAEANRRFAETGLISFGGVHPENENYREILKNLAAWGVPGIKLHPLFQRTAADDIRFLRILDCASELGLIILIHAGFDPGFPGETLASVARLRGAIRTVHPQKLVLAHMGGWCEWEAAREWIGEDVWLDVSSTVTPMRDDKGHTVSEGPYRPLALEELVRRIREHGTDRVLFGSDSPWAGQGEALELIRKSGLTAEELQAVLGGNAARLLGLGPESGSCETGRKGI